MTIKNTIDTYRKRRNQLSPLVIGIGAILLVVIGVVIVVLALGGSKGGGWNPFASKTPTPTITFTPTNTPLPTDTATITLTPTETFTATPSAPYFYTVQQGDTLSKIVQDHNLGDNGILLILLLNPYNPKDLVTPGINPNTDAIVVGQKITLPPPGMPLPTATPWPANAPAGTKMNYFVLPGDNLGNIANKMHSTVDAIIAANKTLLAKGVTTTIYPGWILVVPVNLVTPIPPTRTITPTHTATLPGPSQTPTK
jgi:LysM repeat protein